MTTDQSHFSEKDLSIEFAGATLHGTLCTPIADTPQQVVLMITGSGEIDRNENAMQLQLNTFNSIAHELAARGIASFRYDKRGCAMSGGKYHETGFFNFVDDAEACLNSLHSFSDISDCAVFVMGHGEGALIASYLSASNQTVRGQIMLTPFLENVEKGMERQLQRTLDEVAELSGFKGILVRLFIRLGGNQLNKQRKTMAHVKNTTKSSIKLKKTLINAKWLREIASIDPGSVYRKVAVPSLIIGAENDLQCLPDDAKKIADIVDGQVEVHILSALTHILRVDALAPSTFKYKQLSAEPVDPRVSECVARWLADAQPAAD